MLTQAYGRPHTLDDGVRLAQRLAPVARALSEGKRPLAAIALVRVGLPPVERATKTPLGKAANDAYQQEARDDAGRWVADGFAGLSAAQVDAKVTELIAEAQKVGGWLSSAPNIDAGNEHQCVSLVRSLTNGLAKSGNWREGEKLTPDVIKTLKPGTVIATFDSNGRYGNRAKGNHAAIFLGATGKGIWVLEQYDSGEDKSGQVHKKFYSYNDKRGGEHVPSSYSTLKKQ
ncbi:BPSL0067 family protein [Nitrospirillum sp. BR 11828]|uniref:BPSL0067 family protein n=1 Tax=Nitrospirillum sp. BR 11828 TaxID=3104325 RepID=UPI002ACAC13F|nr:BPSL0067 family protein [Nitrospirillum sp. BR 11828]MDZ5648963.1 BPSL0067 family protein [Nitrospirillum sp. BR 11828]